MTQGFRDPIFKGCTRPAMLFGVPLIPLLLISGVAAIISQWLLYLFNFYAALFVLFVYLPLVFLMRSITRKDDQRLHQMMLRMRMRVRQQPARQLFGAVSFSPLRYKQRK